jgi:hypothetical protein
MAVMHEVAGTVLHLTPSVGTDLNPGVASIVDAAVTMQPGWTG